MSILCNILSFILTVEYTVYPEVVYILCVKISRLLLQMDAWHMGISRGMTTPTWPTVTPSLL